MALTVEATEDALLFKSAHYFIHLVGRRVRLPGFRSPGDLKIGHHDLGDNRFLFSLTLTHRLFGLLILQDAFFQDAKE